MQYVAMLAAAILVALMIVWVIAGSLAPELHLIGHAVVGVVIVINLIERRRKRKP